MDDVEADEATLATMDDVEFADVGAES